MYRFVTRIKPEVRDGVVYIRDFSLSCDGEAEISVSDFEFEPRFAGFGSEAPMYTAYRIDFAVKNFDGNTFVVKKMK